MQLKNDESRYGAVAQLFHWTIVVLIIVQFILANRADDLPLGSAKIAVLAQSQIVRHHHSRLALLRLIWRWFNSVPAEPLDIPQWQRIAARISHIALYALLLITPVIGWLMSSARNFPVSWFGLVTLPDFIAPDQAGLRVPARDARIPGADDILAGAAAHRGALKHHFIDKDNVLRRMLPVKLK